MASRQCTLAIELKDIEREKFDGLLTKRQIRQYFPLSINSATQYISKFYNSLTSTQFWYNPLLQLLEAKTGKGTCKENKFWATCNYT